MLKIPASVIGEPIPGLKLFHRGKVRDTYELEGHPGLLLVVATDRVSIFDFVLNALIPQKGALLTAMSVFWRERVLKDLCVHDLVACGSRIDKYLPTSLHDNPDLHARAVVVRRLEMIPIEAIVRGYLTGSGLKAYKKDQKVCGHRLPVGLKDGDALYCRLFTPTTKAEEGHDEHVPVEDVVERFGGEPERLSLQIFAMISAYALSRGIILADTKFEFGNDPDPNLLQILRPMPEAEERKLICLADEVATPDSSRFWDAREWQKLRADGKSPTSFDKEFVRKWGKAIGIDGRNPLDEADVNFVHSQVVPADVITRTTQIYRFIFWRLTGQKLEVFQNAHMRIKPTHPKMRIEVLSGSESDVPQMRDGLEFLENMRHRGFIEEARRHVVSCHRNLPALKQYAASVRDDVIIVAGAGLAAALPGILKTMLIEEGKGHIPVIGVAFHGSSDDACRAAQLSIEQLPGRPVELDTDGKAYFGPAGFKAACMAAMQNEFLPTEAKTKPAQFDLPLVPT